MDIGIACADDHAVVAVEQEIAIQTIGPGLHREHRPTSAEPWTITVGDIDQR